MKNIRITRIFCMVLAALLPSLILIHAGSAAIGVKEGDWAKYNVEAEVDVPEEMAPMRELEEIEWMEGEVESVSDTTVTWKLTTYYKDGTNETETIEDAIESGFIIEADLGEGAEVTGQFFGEQELTVKINGTVSRTYAGASREVNYVEITSEEYPMTFMNSTIKAYWDKATGLYCEGSTSMSGEYEGETVEVSISLKMTETNLWGAGLLSEQWLWILVVVIIVAVVAAGSAFLLLRRRRAPLPEVTPAPTE